MKFCNRCKQDLNNDKFSANKSTKDGLQKYCIECMKAYRREHYQNNKKQYKDRNVKTNTEIINIILKYKSEGCVDCKNRFPGEPWLLEFDHIDNKKYTISNLRNCGSKIKLIEELNKCQVVCVMCHRRRTATRAGWKENRYLI